MLRDYREEQFGFFLAEQRIDELVYTGFKGLCGFSHAKFEKAL